MGFNRTWGSGLWRRFGGGSFSRSESGNGQCRRIGRCGFVFAGRERNGLFVRRLGWQTREPEKEEIGRSFGPPGRSDFFGKFRAPTPMGDRRRKAIACPP